MRSPVVALAAVAALLAGCGTATEETPRIDPGGRSVSATADPVEVPEDGVLEPGVRYHAPLYVHCGMNWLHLGDHAWRRSDDGPDLETGAGDAPDPSWPVAGQTILGFATLVDGVVEYSIDDGTVIATYERTRKQPPGCD